MKKIGFKRALSIVVVYFMLTVSGCTGQTVEEIDFENNEPVVNLRAVILGTSPEEGMDELYRQLDALTIPELKCTLRFEYIAWGDERRQLNTAILSGEYDLIPGGVFSDYRILVPKNAFLDINDYLYLVPDLQEHYETYLDDALKSCEIDGGLYGIPQYSVGVKNANEGFFYREDLRKEWGLEPVMDLATMEAYLYRAKEEEAYRNEPLITDNRIWTSLWLMLSEGQYLEIDSMQETPFVVARADDSGVLINRMETPEFQEVVRYIRKWKEDGILESNMLVVSDNEGERGKKLMVADRKPCESNAPFWSVSSNYIVELWEAHPEWEYDFFPYTRNDQFWYEASLADSSVISISSRTKNPEIAVKLLEKIHTDQRYYDLLRYGVEGIHYHLINGKLDYSGVSNNNRFGWTPISDDQLSYPGTPINTKWYEETETPYYEWQREISRQAVPDPLDGFALQASGLEGEMEAMERVRAQYFMPILCGYQEDYEKALAEANEVLHDAGFDKYLQNMQEQVAEYMKE